MPLVIQRRFCLLGKNLPQTRFRMTSHAAALTLRGAFSGRRNTINVLFSFLLSFPFFFFDAKYPFHIGTHRQQLPPFILRLMICCIRLLFLLFQLVILSLNLFYLRYLLCTKCRESLPLPPDAALISCSCSATNFFEYPAMRVRNINLPRLNVIDDVSFQRMEFCHALFRFTNRDLQLVNPCNHRIRFRRQILNVHQIILRQIIERLRHLFEVKDLRPTLIPLRLFQLAALPEYRPTD